MRKVGETEQQLKDRRDQIARVIESLSLVNQEINQLKVQTQTTQYKLDCQQALREMHDNNQYDLKLKKLAKDIELSRERAATLEDELRGMCEEWDGQYEEAVR